MPHEHKAMGKAKLIRISFPRFDSWENKHFIDTQSDTTLGLFYFAAGLYAILIIPNTLAIVNQFYLYYHVCCSAPPSLTMTR